MHGVGDDGVWTENLVALEPVHDPRTGLRLAIVLIRLVLGDMNMESGPGWGSLPAGCQRFLR